MLEIVTSFQVNTLNNKPPDDEMYEEVRMMKFKIKPVVGDIALLDLQNHRFIEILWSLGKLDEFFQKYYSRVKKSEQDMFFKLLDNLYQKYQTDLNSLDLKQEIAPKAINGFEMEIFKDKGKKTN